MKLKNLFKPKKKKPTEAELHLLHAVENYEKALDSYDELVTGYVKSLIIMNDSIHFMNEFLEGIIKSERGEETPIQKFNSIEELALHIQVMNKVNMKFISKILNKEECENGTK